jgi:hypothetical protein
MQAFDVVGGCALVADNGIHATGARAVQGAGRQQRAIVAPYVRRARVGAVRVLHDWAVWTCGVARREVHGGSG